MQIALASLWLVASPLIAAAQGARFDANLLGRIRTEAHTIPGALPQTVQYLSIAEKYAPLGQVVEGGGETPWDGVITVFQICFPTGWIMVDAALPEAVHNARRGDRPFLYRPARYQQAQGALLGASSILITHEHGDHVAGLLDSMVAGRLAPFTHLTVVQVRSLLERAEPPLSFTHELAARYPVFEYDDLRPIAPGVVLVAAPGHTPGSQLVYVVLGSGREILLIGDVAWAITGVRRAKQKPVETSTRLRENRALIAPELTWLQTVMRRTKVVVVPSHDGDWLRQLTRQGILVDTLVQSP